MKRKRKRKLKREYLITLVVLCAIIVSAFSLFLLEGKKRKPIDEVHAMWISYIDFTQILWGKSEDSYRSSVDEILNNCEQLEINTLYLHASAFTDAYYPSEIYPTQFVGDKMGDSLEYDPIQIFVEKAKKQQISVHLWINPYRSLDKDKMAELDSSYVIKRWVNENSRNVIFYKDRYYLNPAQEEVKELVVSVVQELLQRYDVDGIHMDDYFYPDHVEEWFDSSEFTSSNFESLTKFRHHHVNDLVQRISNVVHKNGKDKQFGVSPAGNLEYSTETIYGDVKTWVANEWVDYIVPQIYFGYTHRTKPFDQVIKEYEAVVSGTNVDLIVGLALYKVNEDLSNSDVDEWCNDNEILRKQVRDSQSLKNYKGYAFFSYFALFSAEGESHQKMMNQIEMIKDINK